MDAWTFDSRDPEETLEAGRELGRSIGAEGLAIALIGPLGAGKTVFVKGLAEGLGVDPRVVSSPTFVIAQQYVVPEGPEVLHHIDLYRLESADELESIGFYDMFARGAVIAAEWADRFPDVLGREVLTIEFEGPSAESSVASVGEEAEPQAAEPPAEATFGAVGAGRARTASVTAAGDAARKVSLDWSDRLTRARGARRGARPGAGSFVEMRLGMTLVLALGLWLTAQVGFFPVELPICEALVATRFDDLGTTRADCYAMRAPVDQNESSNAEIEGVALLLVGGRIDLNRAQTSLLETLPGIGSKRADAIVRARAGRPFTSVLELDRVPGIGPKTRARLERWLRVEITHEEGETQDG